MTTLQKLQTWYASRCNGDWEHQFGITIETQDNPGWRVEIDLANTSLQGAVFPELRKREGAGDWIMCFREGSRFIGAGDPSKLETILNFFLDHAAADSIH